MEIAFDSQSLRTVCESEARAISELGTRVAEVLKRRLADVRAATYVQDLLVGRLRKLEGPDQHMVLDLYDGHHIVFCANHPNNPTTEYGDIDWTRVSRVRILRIEKNHG